MPRPLDVLKVFVEEPAALRGAAVGTAAASLDALLAPAASRYGRAYLAGTHLSDGPPRVGLTALGAPDVFVEPLRAWAAGRPWSCLGRDGRLTLVPASEVATALARPDGVGALALDVAVADLSVAEALAAVGAGDRADRLLALLDAGASVLVPEPAHDGWDWSVFGPAPLGVVEAVRAHPAGPDVQRFVAPLHLARGEHRFYFEQWALDPPPAWAEPL